LAQQVNAPALTVQSQIWVIVVSLCLLAATGCNRGLASAKAKLQSPAFATSLAAECDGLLRDYEKTKHWLWKAGALTNYAAISSLQPQAVQVIELSGVLICEIQITGGFSHSGIFYAPKPPPDGKQLVRGNWQIKPIGNGFYWYQE
jgi:hypothetical protein